MKEQSSFINNITSLIGEKIYESLITQTGVSKLYFRLEKISDFRLPSQRFSLGKKTLENTYQINLLLATLLNKTSMLASRSARSCS